jgi:putative ABC transport system permease protein
MGAKGRQLGSFLWTEGLIILVSGMVLGFAIGFLIAKMLVKLLTGVFDPAPEVLAIPTLYLVILVLAGCLSTVVAVLIAQKVSQRRALEALRTI